MLRSLLVPVAVPVVVPVAFLVVFLVLGAPGAALAANDLQVGSSAGPSGSQVVIPLSLDNDDAVKGIQTDIQFDPLVVSYVSGAVGARAGTMSYSASVIGGNTLRVILYYSDQSALGAGTGAVANLTFSLVGAGGTQSALTPGGTILSDPQGGALPVTTQAGSISVTGGGGGGTNILAVGTGSGAQGTQVTVPLNLDNDDVVKGIQTDIQFNPAVVGYVSGQVTPRAGTMSYSASVVGGNTLRVILYYADTSTLPAGTGAVANLTFVLNGAGGTQSALTPSGTVLSDPQGGALEATEQAGSISVSGGGAQPPQVTLTSPTGGESWEAGSSRAITWTATDPDTPSGQLLIDLEFSTNAGGSWTSIVNDTANDGTHTWTVPSTATTQARVRVTVSDGALQDDAQSANFTIVEPPAGENTLSVGTGSGAQGTQVTVPLNLDNDDAVKGIQTDIQFNPAVVGYVSGQVTPRAGTMSYSASVVGGNTLRVILYYADTSTLPAGTGAVANLTFVLNGAGGTQSALTPSGTVLSDPQGAPLEVTTQAGSISVSGSSSLEIHLAALKNPGRPRILQVFVSASQPLDAAPTVQAGGSAVEMTPVPGNDTVYQGMVYAGQDAGSLQITASATSGGAEDTDAITVSF